jgi:hypothetical protein
MGATFHSLQRIETRASVLGAQGMQSPAPIGDDEYSFTRAACLRTGFCLTMAMPLVSRR